MNMNEEFQFQVQMNGIYHWLILMAAYLRIFEQILR